MNDKQIFNEVELQLLLEAMRNYDACEYHGYSSGHEARVDALKNKLEGLLSAPTKLTEPKWMPIELEELKELVASLGWFSFNGEFNQSFVDSLRNVQSKISDLEESISKPTRLCDSVNHPVHYNASRAYCDCGQQIEAITVIRHMNFVLGNAMKYIWRADHRNGIEDIKKAIWYLQDYVDTSVNK